MRRLGIILATSTLALVLSGCQKAIPLHSSFWQSKEARVGVAVTTYPDPDLYQQGREQEGLVALVINETLRAQMRGFLRTVELPEFAASSDRFVEKLQQRGFTAHRLDRVVNLEQFPKFSGTGETILDRDLRSLSTTENADLLILLSIDAWGTARQYVLGVPIGPHKALVRARGRLVDLRTNELRWQGFMSVDDGIVLVEGDWDQPPAYPNLTRALHKAADNAGQFLEREFFATRP